MSDKIQQAISYFISMGWTPAQAAGIVANLHAESGLRPDAVGDGGKAYGIAQWHPDRQQNFAAIIGKSIVGSSLEEQLAFVHAELNGTERVAGDALRACITAAEAGACVSKMYERPADREGEAAKRAALATRFAGEQEAAPIEDHSMQYNPQPRPEGGETMLLAELLPLVLNLFAPRAQAQLAKVSGNEQGATQLMQAILDKAATLTNTPADQPVQVVAALQKASPAIVEQVQEHALEFLDKIAPILEQAARWEAEARKDTIVAQDAASNRADGAGLRQRMLVLIWGSVAVLAAFLCVMVILQIIMTDTHKPDNDLVVLFGTTLTYLLARVGDMTGYAFGGVSQSAAATAGIAAANVAVTKAASK